MYIESQSIVEKIAGKVFSRNFYLGFKEAFVNRPLGYIFVFRIVEHSGFFSRSKLAFLLKVLQDCLEIQCTLSLRRP